MEQRIRSTEAGALPIRSQFMVALITLWLPLVVLTLIENTFVAGSVSQPFIQDIVPQVRLRIAMPLLLLADMAIYPAVSVAIENLKSSGIVGDSELPRVQQSLKTQERL